MTTPPLDGPRPFSLRIEDYELLDRAGAFDGHRVELIEGVIVTMNAEFRLHTYVKNRLAYRLNRALEAMAGHHEAFVEPTLALPPHSLPEPDVIVAAASSIDNDYFRLRHVAIVIEVATSTLRTDLGRKRQLYAGERVPEYWVVDLDGGEVHQFWEPAAGGYGETRTMPLAGELRSATMPELAIDGAGIL